MDVRFEAVEDVENDCLTLIDNLDKLETGFDSEIILYPLEDAFAVVQELNVQCAIVSMLVGHLELYDDMQDIDYWINEVREDLE